jgi:hypothetical protein
MLQNIKTLILLTLLLWLKSSIVFSQYITLDSKGDTLICFTQNKAKFLLKSYYELQEVKALDSVNTAEIKALKTTIKSKDKVINYQKGIIGKCDSTITLQKEAVESMVEVVEMQNKQIRKERSKTFIVGFAGLCSTIFLSYIYLKTL